MRNEIALLIIYGLHRWFEWPAIETLLAAIVVLLAFLGDDIHEMAKKR